MTKRNEREIACSLRALGKSIREITSLVGCSKGSVSLWVRNVPLSKKQRSFLDSINPAKNSISSKRAGIQNSLTWRSRREEYQKQWRKLVQTADKNS